MRTPNEIREKNEWFKNLTKEERNAETKKAFYKSVDNILEHLMLNRAMELMAYPEDKEEVDKYIADKSKEYMDKFSTMDKAGLILHSIIDMAARGTDVETISAMLE